MAALPVIDLAATLIHVPAANTAAVVTLAADAAKRHYVHGILYSYSAAPTGGRLTITEGGTTVLDVDVTAAGPAFLPLSAMARSGLNQAIVVTLAAGGAAVVGKLNVFARTAL